MIQRLVGSARPASTGPLAPIAMLALVGVLAVGSGILDDRVTASFAPATTTPEVQPVPRPFPRPGGERPAPADPGAAQAPAEVEAEPGRPAPPVAVPAVPAQQAGAPDPQSLGVSVYPTAAFLASYSAGRGQRYYLFGSNLPFRDMVAYYQNVLDERGDRVFDVPPTHMFEIGRYDDDRMAFPPSVTIKDYTWNGSAGLANPIPNAEPTHYATVIQVVPTPR